MQYLCYKNYYLILGALVFLLGIWILLPTGESEPLGAHRVVYEVVIETSTDRYSGSLIVDAKEGYTRISTRIYNAFHKTHLIAKSVYRIPEDEENEENESNIQPLKSISMTHYPQKSTFYFKKTTYEDEDSDTNEEIYQLKSQWQSLTILEKSFPVENYCTLFAYAYKRLAPQSRYRCSQNSLIYFDQQRLLGFYSILAQDVDKTVLKEIKSPAQPHQTMFVWSDVDGHTGFAAKQIKMTLRRITNIGSVK